MLSILNCQLESCRKLLADTALLGLWRRDKEFLGLALVDQLRSRARRIIYLIRPSTNHCSGGYLDLLNYHLIIEMGGWCR